MKRPDRRLVVAFLAMAMVTRIACTILDDELRIARERADPLAAEVSTLVPVTSEGAFAAVLRQEGAVLLLHNPLSVEALTTRREVQAWVQEDRPPFDAYLAEPHAHPFVRSWAREQRLDEKHGYYERHGLVLWLRQGAVVAEENNPGRQPQPRALLRFRTAEAFPLPFRLSARRHDEPRSRPSRLLRQLPVLGQ